MTLLVDENNPILKQPTPEFMFDTNINDIIKTMFETMSYNNGVGLAAPQIGENIRCFVMSDIYTDIGGVFLNPSILEKSSDKELIEEGCLSFPDLKIKIARPLTITAQWFDINNKKHTSTLDGLAARCFQHELDHLNGICFTDIISRVKLNQALKKRTKTLGVKKYE